MHRSWSFAGLRAYSTGLLRDLNTAVVSEEIDVLEIDFDESLAMIRDGRIQDAKTIVLLQWAAIDGPFAAGSLER